MKTTKTLTFFVPGKPKTAGSKQPFLIRKKDGTPAMKNGRPVIVVTDTSGKAGKDWRSDVRAAAGEAWQGPPHRGKMRLSVTFYFDRPKSHYGTGKNSLILKPTAPDRHEHIQTPDALKLARAVEDALTGIVWHDDCQLATSTAKVWCGPNERYGLAAFVTWTDEVNPEPKEEK